MFFLLYPGTLSALERGQGPDYQKGPLTAFYFEPEVQSLKHNTARENYLKL
jgi:hypothetical protein